jgi:hypothetical protein
MLFLRKFAIILFLFYKVKANKTELCETPIVQLSEDLDIRLNNAIKMQNVYEKIINQVINTYSGINDKLYDMLRKTCYSEKFDFGFRKPNDEVKMKLNSREKTSRKLTFSCILLTKSLFIKIH